MSAPNDRKAATPRVSIGMPIRNGENYVRSALDSLLAQTFEDFEIVISDNGSDDATEQICREYAARDPRIRYLRNSTNLGAAPNYNRVFAEARGAYFKWAAHDDTCAADYLARCVEVLDREPAVVAAYPRTRYVDESGNELRVSRPGLSLRQTDQRARVRELVALEIESDDVFMAIFGLFRAAALRATDLIASYPASDQTLLLELALLGEFQEVDGPLFERRIHPLTSMAKNRTPHDQARWFDPNRERRLVLPVWGLWRAHRRVIATSGLGARARLACRWHLARRFLRKWPALLGEIKKAVFQLFGRR